MEAYLTEGDIGGTQYRNTIRKIGKYQNMHRVENRQNTDTACTIGYAYLKLHPSSVMTPPTS